MRRRWIGGALAAVMVAGCVFQSATMTASGACKSSMAVTSEQENGVVASQTSQDAVEAQDAAAEAAQESATEAAQAPETVQASDNRFMSIELIEHDKDCNNIFDGSTTHIVNHGVTYYSDDFMKQQVFFVDGTVALLTQENCQALRDVAAMGYSQSEINYIYAAVVDTTEHIITIAISYGDDGDGQMALVSPDGSYYHGIEGFAYSYEVYNGVNPSSPFYCAVFKETKLDDLRVRNYLILNDGTIVREFTTTEIPLLCGNYFYFKGNMYDKDNNRVTNSAATSFARRVGMNARMVYTYYDGIALERTSGYEYYDYDYNRVTEDAVHKAENTGNIDNMKLTKVVIDGQELEVMAWGDDFVGKYYYYDMETNNYMAGDLMDLRTGATLLSTRYQLILHGIANKSYLVPQGNTLYAIKIKDQAYGFGRNDYMGVAYWYEFGVKQGTYDDPKGVMGDGTVRGREIYDEETDGWYWLDSCFMGAKAKNKEVWMPYIYQNEAGWDEAEILANASASGQMAEQVANAIRGKEGKWVRYDANGKMYKGWYTVEGADANIYYDQVGNTYYYDYKTGLMAKGWVEIDGVTYHFDEHTGVLQK